MRTEFAVLADSRVLVAYLVSGKFPELEQDVPIFPVDWRSSRFFYASPSSSIQRTKMSGTNSSRLAVRDDCFERFIFQSSESETISPQDHR